MTIKIFNRKVNYKNLTEYLYPELFKAPIRELKQLNSPNFNFVINNNRKMTETNKGKDNHANLKD